MSEHKKSHVATVATLLLFALIATTYFVPVAILFGLAGVAVVSLPIVVWNSIRAFL